MFSSQLTFLFILYSLQKKLILITGDSIIMAYYSYNININININILAFV